MKRKKNTQRGATMVEGAIVLPVFLVLFLTSMECIRLAFISLTSQMVVNRVVREVIIGCPPEETDLPCTSSSRVAYVKQRIAETASSFGLTVTTEEIAINKGTTKYSDREKEGDDNDDDNHEDDSPGANSTPNQNIADDPGGPRDLIVLSVQKEVTLMLGLGSKTLTATAIGRNEPFRED